MIAECNTFKAYAAFRHQIYTEYSSSETGNVFVGKVTDSDEILDFRQQNKIFTFLVWGPTVNILFCCRNT